MSADVVTFFEDLHGSPNHRYVGNDEFQLRTERVSEVDWQDVDIYSQVSTHVRLRNPIISAAMNCISEVDMAIAMAKSGGAAFLHHVNTPEEQKTMAEDVYHYMSGIIETPITAFNDQLVEDVLTDLAKRRKTFRTLPVITREGQGVGLMDSATFTFARDVPGMTIGEAMRPLQDLLVTDEPIGPLDAYSNMKEHKIGRLVLLDQKHKLRGLCLLDDIMRVLDGNPDEYSLDEDGRLIVFASVPTIPDEAVHRAKLLRKYVKLIGIDTSHGESRHALDTLKALKDEVDGVDFAGGNVSTEQAGIEVARLEPDAGQVGQGPGQICSSSDRLGFGTPQASAIYEVAKGMHSINPKIPIIADGGIRDSADTVKAFACGANCVKVGSLVAGTEETPVPMERDKETGNYYFRYWGMATEESQRNHAATRARYGHYGPARKTIFVEGFEKKVPPKGHVDAVIEEHVLGIKLSMSAQGMRDIKDLQQNARFMLGGNNKRRATRALSSRFRAIGRRLHLLRSDRGVSVPESYTALEHQRKAS